MKSLLIPLILLVIGSGSGVAAAMFLFPAPTAVPAGDTEAHAAAEPAAVPPVAAAHAPAPDDHGGGTPGQAGYVRLNNQFLIPVVQSGNIRAMVVLTLGLEVASGQEDNVQTHEPRLRDAFLQVLFDHANTGGFDGVFTASGTMRSLRNALRQEALVVLGDAVTDVLILDIVRQDM